MCLKNLFKKIFKKSLENEPMFFETDSYAELSDFYNNEANKTADVSSAILSKDLEAMSDRLNARRVHDEEVLDFRKMKKKKKENNKEIIQLKPAQSFLNKQDKQDNQDSKAIVPSAIHAPVAVVEPDDDLPEE